MNEKALQIEVKSKICDIVGPSIPEKGVMKITLGNKEQIYIEYKQITEKQYEWYSDD